MAGRGEGRKVPSTGIGTQYTAVPVTAQPIPTLQQQQSNLLPQASNDYLAIMSQMSSQIQQLQQQYYMQQVQQQQQYQMQQPLPAAITQAAAVQAAPVLRAGAAQAPIEMEQQQRIEEQIAPVVPQPRGAESSYAGAAAKEVKDELFPPLQAVQGQSRPRGGRSSKRDESSHRGRRDHRGSGSPQGSHNGKRAEESRRRSNINREESRESSRSTEWQKAGKRKSQATRRQIQKTRPVFNRPYQPWKTWGLQNLLHDRPPPPHPTDEQLEKVEVGSYWRAGDIYYCRNSEGQLVVLEWGKHHAEQCAIMSNKLTHAYGLTAPVSDITECAEIPKISGDLPDSWLRNAGMFYKPKNVINMEHRGMSAQCYCPPTTGDYVQCNQITPLCFRKEYFQPKDHVVPFDPREEYFLPNSSRVFSYSAKSKWAVVQVPTPFLLSWRWDPKPYMAANAQEAPNTWKMKLFYTLASAHAHREITLPFMQEPGQWDSTLHPTWQEPSRHDELTAWSKPLYGSESLNRVLFVQHPARPKEIPIYSCMTREFTVPVLLNNEQPDAIENFLRTKLKPFYSQGFGKVICAVCVLNFTDERPVPSAFSRTQFVNHFSKEHHRNLHVLGLGFATLYHCRLHQALVLYHYCLAHMSDESTDDVYKAPFSSEQMEDLYDLKTSNEIRDLLVNNHQGAVLSPPAGCSHLFGWTQKEDQPEHREEEYVEDPLEQKMDESVAAFEPAGMQAAAVTLSIAATLNSAYREAGFMGTEQPSPNGLQLHSMNIIPGVDLGYPAFEEIHTP